MREEGVEMTLRFKVKHDLKMGVIDVGEDVKEQSVHQLDLGWEIGRKVVP
jgi:hypothetical protein